MKELKADLWEVPADLRVITTNPITRASDGAAVMGRGCAREAKERIPGLEFKFGRMLQKHGNRVMRLCTYQGAVLASYPVKKHWREEAMPELIRRSADQLVALADKFGYEKVALPRPGCGNGRLSWAEVRGILEPILDDRFTVVSK
ncbi:MAG: macro domain-containing protein [Actinomycetota bacterium]|nr:macro domain-containing protein [Actinomycetota bacterium]